MLSDSTVPTRLTYGYTFSKMEGNDFISAPSELLYRTLLVKYYFFLFCSILTYALVCLKHSRTRNLLQCELKNQAFDLFSVLAFKALNKYFEKVTHSVFSRNWYIYIYELGIKKYFKKFIQVGFIYPKMPRYVASIPMKAQWLIK